MGFLSKKLIKLVIFLGIIIGGLEFSTNFFNFNGYKPAVEQALAEKLKVKVELKGDIKYSFIPLPHLELKKIKVFNAENKLLFKASSLGVYSGYFITPAQAKEIKFDKLSIRNGDFNFSYLRDYFAKNSMPSDLGIATLVISNSAVDVFDPHTPQTKKHWFDKLNAKIKLGSLFSKGLTISSDFEINHQQFNFDADFGSIDIKGTSDSSSMSLYNDAMSVNFNGKLEELISNPKLAGKITSKVINLDKFALYFGDSQYLKDVLNKENINIAANLEVTPQSVKFSEMNINSANIEKAIAEVKIDFFHGVEASVNIKIDKINLDNVLAAAKDESSLFSKVEALSQKLLNSFDFEIPEEFDAFFDLEIKSIVLNNDSISNVLFNFDTFSGNISLNTLEFEIPGEGRFKMDGVVTHNKIRPKFIGEITFLSKRFPEILKWLQIDPSNEKLYSFKSLILKSDVSLIPHSLRLINTKSSLDKLLFLGSSNIREGSDAKVNFTTRLKFNKINGDDFGLNKIFDEFIAKLYISDPDKTGETHAKLTDDYRWLRKFSSNFKCNFAANEFIFKKAKYDDFNLSFGVDTNEMYIDKLSAKSELARFNGSIGLSLPSFRPYIDIDFDFDFLDTKFFEQVFPPTLILRNSLYYYLHAAVENKKTKKPKEKSDEEDTKTTEEPEIAIPDLNFYSAHNYDGNIKFKAANIAHDKFSFENIDTITKLNNGVITINRFNAGLFGGSAIVKGNIAVLSAVPNFTFSFAFYNVNPGEFTEFFSGQNKMEGYMSISGSLSTSGSDVYSVVSKIQGDAEVFAKKVTFKGFDLGELVNIPEIQSNITDKLKRIDYYTKYGESFFDRIKGKVVVTNGIVSLDNFILENNRASGVFAAKYDLYNKTINSISKFSFIPIGQIDAIEIKFIDKGLLSNPTVEPDMSKLLDYVTYKSRAGADRVSNEQAQPEDKGSILRKRLR